MSPIFDLLMEPPLEERIALPRLPQVKPPVELFPLCQGEYRLLRNSVAVTEAIIQSLSL